MIWSPYDDKKLNPDKLPTVQPHLVLGSQRRLTRYVGGLAFSIFPLRRKLKQKITIEKWELV